MLAQLMGLCVLEAGGCFCAAVFGRKNEEIVPLSCMAVVLILFLSGVAGRLWAGVYIVCAMAAALYLLSICWVVRTRRFAAWCRSFFSPAGILFIVAYWVICVLNDGRLAVWTDEFSHWADVVKAMTLIDDFSTNPAAHSYFQSYPPAMALFQYFFQGLCRIVDGNAVFSEWRLFFAYQVFVVALVMPFLSGVSIRRPIPALLRIGAVALSLWAFSASAFCNLLIDSFVGVLAGTGFALLLSRGKTDACATCTILLLCATLPLAKDVGLLFAVFLAIAYWAVNRESVAKVADMPSTERQSRRRSIVRNGRLLLLPAFSIALPKLLWTMNCNQHQVRKAFALSVDIPVLLQTLAGKDTGYRGETLGNYAKALTTNQFAIGDTGLSLALLPLLGLLFLLLWVGIRVKRASAEEARRCKRVFLICVVMAALFIFGLAVTYLFSFSAYEAVNLASYGRYCSVLLSTVWLATVLPLSEFPDASGAQVRVLSALLAAVMLFTPWTSVYRYVSRQDANSSVHARAKYEVMAAGMRRAIGEENASIYLIDQENTEYNYWTLRFVLRPYEVNPSFTSSIGEAGEPDGGTHTRDISPAQWKEEVLAEYDYVYLFQIDEYLVKAYASFFGGAEAMAEGALFRVDSTARRLRKVY